MIAKMIRLKQTALLLSFGLLVNGAALAANAQRSAEEAISQALAWLAKQQHDDGHWHFDVDRAAERDEVALSNEATGLALLAYLGAGQTLESRTYGAAAKQAVDFLIANAVLVDGRADLRGHGGTLTSHAIAAFALCELCGMQNEPDIDLRELVQTAVNQSARWQKENAMGGWGIEPGAQSDIRPTVWHLMLLSSAEDCGLKLGDDMERLALDGLRQFQLGDVRDAEGGPFFGMTGPARHPTATALGVYGHLLNDWSPLRPWVAREADYLLSPENHAHITTEGNYFLMEVVLRVAKAQRPAENRWETARRVLIDQLLEDQVLTGAERGSWPPKPGTSVQNSRLAATVHNVMALEVYYRFRPLSLGRRFPQAVTDSLKGVSVHPVRKNRESPKK